MDFAPPLDYVEPDYSALAAPAPVPMATGNNKPLNYSLKIFVFDTNLKMPINIPKTQIMKKSSRIQILQILKLLEEQLLLKSQPHQKTKVPSF